MAKDASVAIAMTENAYNLEVSSDTWLQHLARSGMPLLDRGCGVVGVSYVRNGAGELELTRVDTISGPENFAERKMQMMAEAAPEMIQRLTHPGVVGTVSQLLNGVSGGLELWQKYFNWMEDALGLNAMDPDGQGVVVVAGRSEVGPLSAGELRRWQQINVHMSAGHRIRRSLSDEKGDLPLQSEAIIDAGSFAITDAIGPARGRHAIEKLREAAKNIGKARSRLRHTDPDKALEIWRGLVDGRWSLVDWFDTDGRRYVIARPNTPGLGDPRGLSEREQQVAMYSKLGESSKLIAYRLGIATSTVSDHLGSAMRKLGVTTQVQLAQKLKGLDEQEKKHASTAVANKGQGHGQ